MLRYWDFFELELRSDIFRDFLFSLDLLWGWRLVREWLEKLRSDSICAWSSLSMRLITRWGWFYGIWGGCWSGAASCWHCQRFPPRVVWVWRIFPHFPSYILANIHLSSDFLHFGLVSLDGLKHLLVVLQELAVILPSLSLSALVLALRLVSLQTAVLLLGLVQQLLFVQFNPS